MNYEELAKKLNDIEKSISLFITSLNFFQSSQAQISKEEQIVTISLINKANAIKEKIKEGLYISENKVESSVLYSYLYGLKNTTEIYEIDKETLLNKFIKKYYGDELFKMFNKLNKNIETICANIF